jgi:hypothetical protein
MIAVNELSIVRTFLREPRIAAELNATDTKCFAGAGEQTKQWHV